MLFFGAFTLAKNQAGVVSQEETFLELFSPELTFSHLGNNISLRNYKTVKDLQKINYGETFVITCIYRGDWK